MRTRLILPVLWLASTALVAQTIDDAQRIAQERARIAAEREQLKGGLFEKEKACYQRFAVNGCLRKVRREQREALVSLRQQEVRLNDEERSRKAAERMGREAPAATEGSAPAAN